ncbi:hypothetical protein AFL01nite_20910 [Aeromicrobium flavum]|uniref:Uncharacterized protein n=1 Tax=Aeromicrobium flavum TaxID=416568 RepID=A0A512HWE4_9ACTN|nr:hypothetical protein [Aeromicrobium flavum]GEO89764.1 hypothetical protein AFL01nite_20910 [Aeromicrobium flavum]
MTTPATTCPWWCTDHRSGPTTQDEQHARVFPVPDGAWVAILLGALPSDRPELAYGAESYTVSAGEGRAFAAALHHAADLYERIVDEHGRLGRSARGRVSARGTP